MGTTEFSKSFWKLAVLGLLSVSATLFVSKLNLSVGFASEKNLGVNSSSRIAFCRPFNKIGCQACMVCDSVDSDMRDFYSRIGIVVYTVIICLYHRCMLGGCMGLGTTMVFPMVHLLLT